MTREELREAIYEELYNELHKKGHKDPKGRKLMKGDKDLNEVEIAVQNAPQWSKDLNSAFKEGGIFHDLFGAGGDDPETKKMERQMAFLDLQSQMSQAEREKKEAEGVLALNKKGIPADKAKGVYQATVEAKKAAIQTKLLKKAISSKKFQKLSPEVQEKMTKNYEDNKKATEENFNSIADEYEKNGIKVPAAIQKSRGDSSNDAKGIKQPKAKAGIKKTTSTKTKSASSTSGKQVVNPKTGKKIKATSAIAYGKGHPAYKDAKKALGEAINKSDAKYTMKMVFDNHGFGKALKHMKILRSGITLNMSSYMGPSKTLNKIVKDFNDIMGTKYKADVDSFQKGHVTSIELKEGKLTERVDYKYLTQVILDAKPKHNVYYNSGHNKVNIGGVGYDKGDLVQNFNQKPGSSSKIKNNFYYANQDPENTKKEVEKLSRGKIKVDIQKGYGGKPVVVYIVKEGKNGKVHEAPFGFTGVPFPSETPNEFAYMDFAKYVKKNEKKMIKFLKPIRPDAIFKALQDLWRGWDRKANKGEYSNIRGNKFGRELALMLRKDGLLFKNTGNKITNLKEKDMKLRKIAEATNLWKHFDAKMKLQDTIMDLEYEMKMINKDLSQLHKDMEQEAEPGGGKIADRYGREIEKKEKEYKKKRAEFDKLMKKLDKMEQY